MDELDKKAQKGLEAFSRQGDLGSVKSALDGMVDDILGDDEEVIQEKDNRSNFKWLYIAASIVGLCAIGYLGFRDGSNAKQKLDPPAIYAQYFEVLPNMNGASERGESEAEVVSDSDIAMKMYNQNNFEGAAQILKDAVEAEYLVYGGIAEMKNKAFASAIDIFEEAQELDADGQYKDIISWYLALAQLEDGNLEEAKNGFSIIANSKHYKSKEAAEILKSL